MFSSKLSVLCQHFRRLVFSNWCLWQGFRFFHQTQPVFTNNRWCRHDPGKLCGHNVRQVQYSWWLWWCKAGHVCLEAVKLAAYQSGCICGQTILCQTEAQSPAEWARKVNLWQILWTDLAPIVESCQQQTKCGCKSKCFGRCKCYSFGLACTALYSCRFLY